MYVEDLAEGVVSALVPHAAGRTYNLVGDEAVSVREVADIVRRLVSDVPIVHVPSRPADLHRAEISGARAWRELGWQPLTTFEEGVCRYTSWLAATNVKPLVADGGEHRRQRGGRPAPGARRAVVVGVVQQHDVSRREPRVARRSISSGVSRFPQSRPQRDQSSGASPSSRTRLSAPALNTP